MLYPKVTVLMPVYNAEKYVRGAVDSVLNQSFRDFGLLIIHDGSTDRTQTILESYKDPRIRIINHKINRGIVSSLNEGLSRTKSTYIARMDADDIALPSRLEKQVAFMDNHPLVAVCGTWLKAIRATKSEIWKAPATHNEIRALMMFHDAIFHPTVILRSKIIHTYNLRYSKVFPYAEDYELWIRIMKHSVLANLPEVLLHHRIHHHKHLDEYLQIQETSANRIRLSQIHTLGIRPNKNEIAVHNAISNWNYTSKKLFMNSADKWLLKLILANHRIHTYPHKTFAKVIANTWSLMRTGRRDES